MSASIEAKRRDGTDDEPVPGWQEKDKLKGFVVAAYIEKRMRNILITVLTLPWLFLGPANIYKVAVLNRGSPIAKYIVVPPAETCQSECDIARMWACLFWGLQFVVAFGILTGGIGNGTAALAKFYVGIALRRAYAHGVVHKPVQYGANVEIFLGLTLLYHKLAARKAEQDAATKKDR